MLTALLAFATVCPTNATNKCITWCSSDTSVATVNPTSGLVMAQSVGTATIYATAQDGSGKYGSCKVTVEAVPVSSIAVCPTSKTMRVGESAYLTATVYPTNATNKSLTWSSSNPDVACVNSSSGLVIAKETGTAVISAISKDGSGEISSSTITVLRSKFGSLEYNGEIYDIFVPNHLETSNDYEEWTTVDTRYVADTKFDLFKFISGIDMPDEETGLYAPGNFQGEVGRSVLSDLGMKAPIGIASIFAGILNSIYESISTFFVKFIFQKTSDKKKGYYKSGV